MTAGPELVTARLRLRRWRPSDLEPFAALNSDPLVMEHFPATLDRAETQAAIERFEAGFEERSYGLWAVEVAASTPFIGFVGLNLPPFDAHFTPAVEVGWRLGREHWGQGYATEAAQEAVRFGFEDLGLEEIVSFTVPANTRSRRVMERLGMSRDPSDDFEHPRIQAGSPCRRHVLYRLPRAEWRQASSRKRAYSSS